MSKQKLLVYGFGVVMLSMAVAQFLTLSYFNHVLRDYLLPIGEGVKPLAFFIFPISVMIIVMEGLCALAIFGMSDENPLRETFVKLGIAVALLWLILVLSALVRGVPGYAGFFGEKLRQPRSWFILVENLVLLAWASYALRHHEEV